MYVTLNLTRIFPIASASGTATPATPAVFGAPFPDALTHKPHHKLQTPSSKSYVLHKLNLYILCTPTVWIKTSLKCFAHFTSQGNFLSLSMRLYEEFKEILKIQKLRRSVSFAGFYGFTTLIIYAYVNNTYVACKQKNMVRILILFIGSGVNLWFWCFRTRAGYSRADQYYASYPAGTELLTDTSKVFAMLQSWEWLLFDVVFVLKYDCSV